VARLGFKHAPNSFDLHSVIKVKVLVKVLVSVIYPKVIVTKRSQVRLLSVAARVN